MRLAWGALGSSLSILVVGCGHDPGLNKAVRDAYFVPITPPQTALEPGLVAEVDPRVPEAPVIRASPTGAGVTPRIYTSQTPDASTKHEEKTDLSLGVTLPQDVQTRLSAKGAHTYSVVSTGNEIRRVYIDEYAQDIFPKLAEKYGGNWAGALAQSKLYYFFELWCSKGLEYRFYDEHGIDITAKLDVKAMNLGAAAGYSMKDDGSLIFASEKDTICIGYKARPIRKKGTGEIGPEGGGTATPWPPQATVAPYQ